MAEPDGVVGADLGGAPPDAVGAVWAHALGVDAVDPDAGFFDLGATSATVVAVVRELRRRWPDLRMIDVFAHPTVTRLAEVLGGLTTSQPSSSAIGTNLMFTPTVQVIAAQPAVLSPPDLSFEAILKHFPGLAEADAVCLTGSTAAGWSNTFSDIDLYAFADRELDLPIDETMEMTAGNASGVRWVRWIGTYDTTRVDLKVWPTDALPTALEPYLGAEIEFSETSEYLQDFVYRLNIGRPLNNEDFFARMRTLLAGSSYQRALARMLKVDAENCLTDVAGQLDSGDFKTARVSAGLAAVFVADACLVLSGELCRRPKWLLRRLESTPECGIGADEYRSMVMDAARPGESDGDVALRIARWSQAHIVRLEDAFLTVAS